jgi:hypothetical protein
MTQFTEGTIQTQGYFIKSMTMYVPGRAHNPDAVIFHYFEPLDELVVVVDAV